MTPENIRGIRIGLRRAERLILDDLRKLQQECPHASSPRRHNVGDCNFVGTVIECLDCGHIVLHNITNNGDNDSAK